MCVIAICPAHLRPSLATVTACATANPHGAGVAWREGNRVLWRKGFSDPGELKAFIDGIKGEAVTHFRWASVGEPVPALCHPFPVSGKPSTALQGAARRVLFHNGTWSQWRNAVDELGLELDGPVSDTRVAAATVSHVGDIAIRRMPGRWVVMTAKGLDTYGDFQTRKGIRYSNLNWVSHLPENLQGGPVRIVDEHGSGAGLVQPDLRRFELLPSQCEPPDADKAEGWSSSLQRMADKTGRAIRDIETGQTFTPRSCAKQFDYRRWYREQQEGRGD